MKKLLFVSLLVLSTLVFAAEEKKVCVDKVTSDGKVVKDKEGKPQQTCKTIKIHKKLEVEKDKK